MTGSLIPLGSYSLTNETAMVHSHMFRSGVGVWAIYNVNSICVQAYTESPYSYANWRALTSDKTTSSVTHLWHDNGSFILASPSGANFLVNQSSGIQLTLAALPTS